MTQADLTHSASSGAGDPAGDATRATGTPVYAEDGLRVERIYTTEGVHPYAEVSWERRDIVMTNWRDGLQELYTSALLSHFSAIAPLNMQSIHHG